MVSLDEVQYTIKKRTILQSLYKRKASTIHCFNTGKFPYILEIFRLKFSAAMFPVHLKEFYQFTSLFYWKCNSVGTYKQLLEERTFIHCLLKF